MIVIALDGPAASGKGTLSKRLARQFSFAHLDTGKLYRAVGLAVVKSGGDPEDEDAAVDAARALDHTTLGDPELAGDEAAAAASKVASIPAVREALKEFQRNFAETPPDGAAGAVLDGRDIGTVICPDATAKLFVTADVEERAKRRHKELLDRGETSIYAAVLADLQDRDHRDRNRSTAPLVPADDATVLDTTELDAEAAFKEALQAVEPAVREALETQSKADGDDGDSDPGNAVG